MRRLVLAFAAFLLACDENPAPAPDAAPTTCDYHGTVYQDGEIFPAGDGCNSCKCNPDGQSPGEYGCTLRGCSDAGPPDATVTTCDYHGTIYQDGEIFPAGDGCNSCKCNPDGQSPGQYGCTAIGCFDAGPPDAAR